MARRRRDNEPVQGAPVVRRAPGDRRPVPPDVEALASGRVDKLPQPARRPRLKDPRVIAMVPGVANRDARALYEARVAELKQAAGPPRDEAALAEALAEAVRLGLWRGRSVTSFDAFAEEVLRIPAAEARELAQQGAARMGAPCERATDEAVAAWMRCEAALREAGVRGRVRVLADGGAETLRIDLDTVDAPQGIDAMAHRMVPLVRDRDRDRDRDRGRDRGPERGGERERGRGAERERERDRNRR
jgi:putative intracellular protease/amidase